jgi:WD40 repeat protein
MPCVGLAMSGDGSLLATGGNDALLTIWNTACTELINTIYQIDFPCNSVGISHDGSMLAYTGASEKGRLASVEIAEGFASADGTPPVLHRCAPIMKTFCCIWRCC